MGRRPRTPDTQGLMALKRQLWVRVGGEGLWEVGVLQLPYRVGAHRKNL